jgi:hypothetical protein
VLIEELGAEPEAELRELLRAIGVPGPDIPAEEDKRATRSLLAGKRMLVVLG